jgi:hypothetical protein
MVLFRTPIHRRRQIGGEGLRAAGHGRSQNNEEENDDGTVFVSHNLPGIFSAE